MNQTDTGLSTPNRIVLAADAFLTVPEASPIMQASHDSMKPTFASFSHQAL